MAHWAKLRTHELSELFQLKRECMPHSSTWSRVLGHGVEPKEVEQIIGQLFAQTSRTAHPKRGSTQLAIDGKTPRGTIPLRETEAAHLLALHPPPQRGDVARMHVQ